MRKLLLIIICFILLFPIVIKAQIQLSESAKISLMTTSPWSGASYALYGHTAIYVVDDSTDIEGVFNYGFFDSSQPNFIFNFMRGKTDYVLGVQSLEQFVEDYREKGVEVVEQELNMTKDEKQKMWNALYINQLPENRGYRYNYFYDNCVTRPRDLIETYIDGEIIYPTDDRVQTYRDLIHECVDSYPWMKFGIDLVIGSDADKPISLRQKMFLPVYLKEALGETYIVRNDSVNAPIVSDSKVIIDKTGKDRRFSEWNIGSPLPISFALIIISIFISMIQYNTIGKTKLQKIFDSILFGVVGVGGAIIFFMMFFSEHPATSSNWNFVWMNLFALVIPLFVWLKPMKNVVNIYHFINFVALSLFLLLWWFIPQQLPIASITFSMSILIRSATNVLMLRKDKLYNRKYSSSKQLKAGWGTTL